MWTALRVCQAVSAGGEVLEKGRHAGAILAG